MKNLSRLHPKNWRALTWICVCIWTGYAIGRNYPYEKIENSILETRIISDRFALEIDEIARIEARPAGWPLYCVRPNVQISWDILLFPAPIGAAGINVPRGPRAKFFPWYLRIDVGLIFLNLLALVYVTRTRISQFSLRTLMFLTVAASVCFLLWKSNVVSIPWQGADSYFVVVYFAPILLAVITLGQRLISPSENETGSQS